MTIHNKYNIKEKQHRSADGLNRMRMDSQVAPSHKTPIAPKTRQRAVRCGTVRYAVVAKWLNPEDTPYNVTAFIVVINIFCDSGGALQARVSPFARLNATNRAGRSKVLKPFTPHSANKVAAFNQKSPIPGWMVHPCGDRIGRPG